MLYSLKQGPTEKTIIEQSLRMNQPLPKAIENAPVLAPGLFFYFLAYNEIATCRQYVDGVALKLPWNVIHDWCRAHHLDDDEEEDVKYHVWALDEAETAYHKSKKGKGKIGDGHQPAQPENSQPARPTRKKRQR